MIISLLSGCGCSKNDGEDPSMDAKTYDFTTSDVSYDMESDVNYINNIVLIFFNKEPSEARKKAIAKLAGGTLVGEDKNVNQIQIKVRSTSLKGLKQLCERLKKEKDINHATYDVATKIEKEPAAGTKKEKSTKSGKVQQSDEMKIGIVDGGFDADHEDLDITILNPDMADKNDHGTHVAGIIGAINDNGIGIDGVVPDAQMLGYDWMPNEEQSWNTTTQILTGLSVCVENGAKIVNFSMGLSDYDLTDETKTKSKTLLDKTAELSSIYMSQLLEKGYDFAVVQAAGNGALDGRGIDAVNNGFFCSVNASNCITIGDVTKEDIINRIVVVAAAERPDANGRVVLTKFSNAGSRVDVAAPGSKIYSCICDNQYGKKSGTSMAAPMVAGYLAVEWDKDDSMTGDELKGLFKSLPTKAYDNTESHYARGDFPFVDLWDKFKDPDAKSVATKAPTTKPPVKDDMTTLLAYYGKGDYNQAASINKKMPEYAQEACVKNMPKKIKDDFYDMFYKMEGNGVEMYFTDVDNDNDADMLVKCGTCEADYYVTWFRNENNRTITGGMEDEIGASHTAFSAYPGHNGFIKYQARMDNEVMTLVQYQNGKLVEKVIGERDTTNYLILRNQLKIQKTNYVLDDF